MEDRVASLIDLRDRAGTPQVLDLVAHAVDGDGSSTASEVAELFATDRSRFLAGMIQDDALVGLVGGQMLHGRILVMEILAIDPAHRRAGRGRALVDAAGDALGARVIRLDADADVIGFYERCGFTARPIPGADGGERFRAERRHPPEPDGFFTGPAVSWAEPRRLTVELPPEGNTLPLLPERLRGRDVPPFVLRWVLDADEVGLMLQALHPEQFPPVTPAVRPTALEDFMGPPLHGWELDERGDLAGLPPGVSVSPEVLDTIEMCRRIDDWLRTGRRVQAWSRSVGAGDEIWIEPEPSPRSNSSGSGPGEPGL